MAQKTIMFTGANGLHARPAGTLVKKAKEFKEASPKIIFEGNEVNATSLVKLLSLGVKKNSEVTVTASGDNAETAVNEIANVLESIVD